MKNLKLKFQEIIKDESAQGATEYILLIVAVVAVLGIFRDQITSIISDKMGQVGGQIGGFGN